MRYAQLFSLDTGSSPVWSVVAGDDATDNDRAATGTVATVVVGTVATVGGGVAAADDTVIDGTVTDTGSVKKRNFHTGLDPVSRTKNSAQPTEFDAVVGTADKVRYALIFSGYWSVVAGAVATDSDRAATGTVATDDNRAAVAGTVATVGDGVGDGAVAAADDTVIDGTVVTTGTVEKQNFHTGLDPVSRTNNSA